MAVMLNKSDVQRGSPEWAAVEERMHRLLAPVIRRLTREEAHAASPQSLRTADQVRRILARALRLLESGRLFESEVGSGPGSGDRGQLTLEGYAERPVGDDGPEAGDEPLLDAELVGDDPTTVSSTPPMRTGGQGRGGRTGIGEVVIRALDSRLRSAMVVEDGVRRVVINSRYPLYEVRKGDLWFSWRPRCGRSA